MPNHGILWVDNAQSCVCLLLLRKRSHRERGQAPTLDFCWVCVVVVSADVTIAAVVNGCMKARATLSQPSVSSTPAWVH